MKFRMLKAASIISTLLLVLTLIFCVASIWINPWNYRLSLSNNFHLGVWGQTFDIRLVIFNDAEYGPYRGSIISVSDGQGNEFPKVDRKIGFGDTAGVYYRYFRWPDSTVLWTLMISLWYFVALFAILPTLWIVRHLRS
jgi:hypothetical protein